MADKNTGKLLDSAKGLDREALKRQYITGERESVNDFLRTIFSTKIVQENGTVNNSMVKENIVGRRDERADYWDEYFRSVQIKPTIRKGLIVKMEELAETHTQYIGAFISHIRKQILNKDGTPKEDLGAFNVDQFLKVHSLITPFIAIGSNNDEKAGEAKDFIGELKKAIASTAETRAEAKKTGQSTGGNK